MNTREELPYRPNVGIALFNRAGLVFAGRCFSSGPEVIVPGFEWQMPQGGLEPDEDTIAAARRELYEETGITRTSVLAVCDEGWQYDFPPYSGPPHKLSGFRGQQQRWVALRFEGEEREIDVLNPGSGAPAEFLSWDWFPLGELPLLVVPYKREVYERVLEAFGRFAAVSRHPPRLRSKK